MKLTFVVCNEFFLPRLMTMLEAAGIDYYTQWENARGKGRGTDPHLGRGSYSSTNAVTMIAFEDEAPLEALVAEVTRYNAAAVRKDDRIRIFELPLARIV